MNPQTFVIALLLMPVALAVGLDSEYLIIAETPRDVVAGANFAASVNQFATFSAVLMEDAQTLTNQELSNKYIVIIQDEHVVFLGRDDYSAVFERYFREQEYELGYVSLPRQEDLRFPQETEPPVSDEVPVAEPVIEPEAIVEELEDQAKKVVAEPVQEFVCPGCSLDGVCWAIGDTIWVDGVLMHECTAEGLVPAEEPSIFTRIFSWFKNIF